MTELYRRHGRTPLNCDVTLENETLGKVVAEARDVSVTGLFVRCRELIGKIAIGDAIKAKFAGGQQGQDAPPVQLDSRQKLKVVRVTDDGVALTND